MKKMENESKRTAHQMTRWAVEKIMRLFLIVRNSTILSDNGVDTVNNVVARTVIPSQSFFNRLPFGYCAIESDTRKDSTTVECHIT